MVVFFLGNQQQLQKYERLHFNEIKSIKLDLVLSDFSNDYIYFDKYIYITFLL